MKGPLSIPVTDLIPHRPPMVLIDSLVEATSERALATKTFRGNDYGLEDDVVVEPALVECIAQTVAAMHGYETLASGERPGVGYLAGVARFSIRSRPRKGESLTIETQAIRRLGAMRLIRGKILSKGQILAEGELKFYIP